MGVFLDAGIGEHWPDLAATAFIACIGWLLKRDISAMDKRHERAEDKFEEIDKVTSNHETRITVIEKVHARER